MTGCSTGDLAAGATCISSQQCATGLLCDTTQAPAICTDKLGSRPNGFVDASTGYDFAGRDLSGGDPPDLSAAAHDMATTAADLAKHDGG